MDGGDNVGQCYISIKGMKNNLLMYKASGSFKLMGLTDATGDPVLCKRILNTKSLSVTDVKGFDYRTSIPYESNKNTEENLGESKALLEFLV